MRKLYWKRLVKLVYTLCQYYKKYESRMPSDLPASVATAMSAVDVACTALIAYDKAHPGGMFHAD